MPPNTGQVWTSWGYEPHPSKRSWSGGWGRSRARGRARKGAGARGEGRGRASGRWDRKPGADVRRGISARSMRMQGSHVGGEPWHTSALHPRSPGPCIIAPGRQRTIPRHDLRHGGVDAADGGVGPVGHVVVEEVGLDLGGDWGWGGVGEWGGVGRRQRGCRVGGAGSQADKPMGSCGKPARWRALTPQPAWRRRSAARCAPPWRARRASWVRGQGRSGKWGRGEVGNVGQAEVGAEEGGARQAQGLGGLAEAADNPGVDCEEPTVGSRPLVCRSRPKCRIGPRLPGGNAPAHARTGGGCQLSLAR
jgi:hypothetical protein